jgi:hypothetical protein
VYQPGNIPEPNSLVPGENCAVANATQTYEKAWGWADANCAQQFAFMCKIPGKAPRAAFNQSNLGLSMSAC